MGKVAEGSEATGACAEGLQGGVIGYADSAKEGIDLLIADSDGDTIEGQGIGVSSKLI